MTLINAKGEILDTTIIKSFRDSHSLKKKLLDTFQRVREQSYSYLIAVREIKKSIPIHVIGIEQPVLSWGFKNIQTFGKSLAFYTLVWYRLAHEGFRVIPINNRQAKKVAGYGHNKKPEMIAAFKKRLGHLPGHPTKYGQETLADSYFIALTTKRLLSKPDQRGGII